MNRDAVRQKSISKSTVNSRPLAGSPIRYWSGLPRD
jgi:hypothetical protein